MDGEDETIISEESKEVEYDDYQTNNPGKLKKILLIVGLAVAVSFFVIIIVVIVKRQSNKIDPIAVETGQENNNKNEQDNVLPDLNGENLDNATSTQGINLNNLEIEYLSFSDFYKNPEKDFELNIDNYELPINIKIDGLNYYDLSRKINLDPVINDLNSDGFAVLESPWQNEVDDFYGVYKKLEEKQIPFLITSDFIIYYYQNMIKQMFKGVEESVFYDNLWTINKELYEVAKNRYESRLATIGNINDAVLEGQRMEMAFFAVSLELLKPGPGQIAAKGAIEDKTKFSEGDVEKFYFNAPPYLRNDVLEEVQLIRSASEKIKSPDLLYIRDYREFAVPKEYKADAKLNNFYLAATWISSLFPVEYQSDGCPDCLLDQEDWRLSMIASSLISTDFSSRDNLKGQWAMIYKLMAFFQGLREEIDYVDFRDSLISVFGENYEVEALFDDQNALAMDNLDKLKGELMKYNFSAIRGAIDKTNVENKKLLGFKMLTDAYWPNDYIFNRLTWPNVGVYQGLDSRPNNLTACEIGKKNVRCNGFSLDIANLVTPMTNNPVFIENTNYLNYEREASILNNQLMADGMWHTSNYWTTISLMKSVISEGQQMPVYAKSDKWQQKKINTAVSAWVNLQLPLDELSLTPIFEGQILGEYFSFNEFVYVEPNIDLLDELIATNNMIAGMFSALGLNKEINLSSQTIKTMGDDLSMLREIVVKELTSEKINESDSESLRDFAKRYKIENIDNDNRVLYHDTVQGNRKLFQDLRKLNLIAIVHKIGENKVIAVGPVWNYKESR